MSTTKWPTSHTVSRKWMRDIDTAKRVVPKLSTETEEQYSYPNTPSSPTIDWSTERQSSDTALRILLTCHVDQIPKFALEAIAWLRRQSTGYRDLLLRRLQRVIRNEFEVNPGQHVQNLVAACEILVHFDRPYPVEDIRAQLRVRPVSGLHLYLVPILRSDSESSEAIVNLLDDILRTPIDEREDWHGMLVVECYRALELMAPAILAHRGCELLPKVGDLQLTATLEHVSRAIRRSNTSEPMKERLAPLWNRVLAEQPINRNGILARILELRALCGEAMDEILADAERCDAPEQIMYLLSQRDLTAIPAEYRRKLYVQTWSSSLERGHRMAVKKLVDVFADDPDVDFFELLRDCVG